MDDRNLTNLLAWAGAIPHLSYYQILGIAPDASNAALARAFRAFAMTFHPDTQPSLRSQERETLGDVFQHGAEAYKVLSNPALRSLYDRALRAGRLRLDQGTISLPPSRPDWTTKLDERCRSAGAKLKAVQAQKLFHQGDLGSARAALADALAYDGGANLELERYIEDLDLRDLTRG